MDAFLVPQPTDSDADAASHATELTDSDATEHAAEVQGRGSFHHHQQVMLQSAPAPVLRYFAYDEEEKKTTRVKGKNRGGIKKIIAALNLSGVLGKAKADDDGQCQQVIIEESGNSILWLTVLVLVLWTVVLLVCLWLFGAFNRTEEVVERVVVQMESEDWLERYQREDQRRTFRMQDTGKETETMRVYTKEKRVQTDLTVPPLEKTTRPKYPDEITVTPNGEKYHLNKKCRGLNGSPNATPYERCKLCVK